MREIKFRAWDKKEKMMLWWASLRMNTVGLRNSLEGDGNWVPMQFTGLKDKNGKEIYEGDIVITYSERREVIFCSGAYMGEIKDGRRFILDNNPDMIEVIGNIYENPELLAQRQKGEGR